MENSTATAELKLSFVLRFWRQFPCPPPWCAMETLEQIDWSRLGDYATDVRLDFVHRCEVSAIPAVVDPPITSEVLGPVACDYACRTAIFVVCSFFIVFSALAIVCLIHRRRREGCSMTEATKRGRQLTHDIRNFHFRKKKPVAIPPDSSALTYTPYKHFTVGDERDLMLQVEEHSATLTSSKASADDSLLRMKMVASSHDDTVETVIYESINDDVIYSDPELIRKRYTLPPPDTMRAHKRHGKHHAPSVLPLPEDFKMPDKSRYVARPFSVTREVNSDYNIVVYENTRHRLEEPPKSCTHIGLSSISDGYLSPQDSPKHFNPSHDSSQACTRVGEVTRRSSRSSVATDDSDSLRRTHPTLYPALYPARGESLKMSSRVSVKFCDSGYSSRVNTSIECDESPRSRVVAGYHDSGQRKHNLASLRTTVGGEADSRVCQTNVSVNTTLEYCQRKYRDNLDDDSARMNAYSKVPNREARSREREDEPCHGRDVAYVTSRVKPRSSSSESTSQYYSGVKQKHASQTAGDIAKKSQPQSEALRVSPVGVEHRLRDSYTPPRHWSPSTDRSLLRSNSRSDTRSFVPVVHSTPVKMYNHPKGGRMFLQERSIGCGYRGGRLYSGQSDAGSDDVSTTSVA